MGWTQKITSEKWEETARSDAKYMNKWIMDTTWCNIMKSHFSFLNNLTESECNAGKLNNALARTYPYSLDFRNMDNLNGRFRSDFTFVCPYDKKLRSIKFYKVTEPGKFTTVPLKEELKEALKIFFLSNAK